MDAETMRRLLLAIEDAGGYTAVARAITESSERYVYPQLVQSWLRAGRVPAEWAMPLANVLEDITREDLRPDLYP